MKDVPGIVSTTNSFALQRRKEGTLRQEQDFEELSFEVSDKTKISAFVV